MSDHDIQIKKQIYKCQTMIYKLPFRKVWKYQKSKSKVRQYNGKKKEW